MNIAIRTGDAYASPMTETKIHPGIIFTRHVLLIAAASLIGPGYEEDAYWFAVIATFILSIGLAGLYALLAWVFFTESQKDKKLRNFLVVAWALVLIEICSRLSKYNSNFNLVPIGTLISMWIYNKYVKNKRK